MHIYAKIVLRGRLKVLAPQSFAGAHHTVSPRTIRGLRSSKVLIGNILPLFSAAVAGVLKVAALGAKVQNLPG
jgi:hypothetical protein